MFRNSLIRNRFRLLIAIGLAGCQPTIPSQSPSRGLGKPSDAVSAEKSSQLDDDAQRNLVGSSRKKNTLADGTSLSSPTAPVADRFRPDDHRPLYDEARITAAGIRIYESKRLRLFTDVANTETEVEKLPELVDRLYEELEGYFGTLPPNRARTEFQMNGYLIRDLERFRNHGLLPEEFTFEHGVQRRNEFWVRDQEFDYYRRHLLLHEATHCFMNYTPDVDAPIWYLEGMAEYFAAHRIVNSSTRFRVMPTSSIEFEGFGRLAIIRRDVAAAKTPTIASIISWPATTFTKADPYAWSWALCAFLDGTPRYRERFRKLGAATQDARFEGEFLAAFPPDDRDFATEWQLFLANLQYGYDLERAAIDFKKGTLLNPDQPEASVSVTAERGWQSSGVLLEAGRDYEVVAEGQFTLTQRIGDEQPWVSEPQGISFRYFGGRPIGTLIGCVRAEEGPTGGVEDSMLQTITLGNRRTFRAPLSGTLYLRLNDAWNSLSDNRGDVRVIVRQVNSIGQTD